MRRRFFLMAAQVLLALWPVLIMAQTPDEIVEKHLSAVGGRAALSRLTSRLMSGSVTLTTPIGPISGTAEVYMKSPNKMRTLIKLNGSAFGIPEILNDQRFDGVSGYVIDSIQGNRDLAGPLLDGMRNQVFPSLLLNYGDRGVTVALAGREKVGDKEAYVLVLTPKTGPAIRAFIDVQSMMLVKTAVTANVPEAGGDIEQINEFSDFREVDGVKVPFATRTVTPLQSVTATIKEVKHNIEIDDSSFSKPKTP
jgi:zinc protease